MNNWPGLVVLAVIALTVFGGWFLRRWLVKQYRAGRISGRRAGWIYSVTTAAPLVLLAALVALADIRNLWIMLLLLVLTLPVMFVTSMAIFRKPEEK